MTDETLFAAAVERPDPVARAAYLDSACPDPETRRRIDALLAAHDRAGDFLARPAVALTDPEVAATKAFAPDAGADHTRTHGGTVDTDTDEALGFLAPPRRPDSLGRIGHYEVLEVLGRGGFGIVFRAFDDVLQRVVAVKVLAPSMAVTSPARKRFLREARSSAQVRHENVVQVFSVEEAPLPYLVMEFIPGETLQQRLDRTGPLDVPEILRIGRQVAAGLAAAHETGLIHRDIKPSNILIDSGPQERVKITDFGLARAADDASISQSGVVAGTPMYMAPEQAKGDALDHRADLFSLGSVLYVMCTGRPPFRASGTLAVLKRVCDEDPRPIREVIPEVPEWLCRIIEKLHAKSPDERFQSAKEVAEVLADCEKQLAAHNELRDASRIPEARELAPPQRTTAIRRWAKGVLMLCALVGVFLTVDAVVHSLTLKDFDQRNWDWAELAGRLTFTLAVMLVLLLFGIRWARRFSVASAKPAAPRSRARRWVWNASVVLALGAMLLTALPFPYLYASNKADLIFLSQTDPDVNGLIVRRDGEVVARLKFSNRRATLPPGDYEVEAECSPEYEATKFYVKTVRLTSASNSYERVEERPIIKLRLRRGDTTSVATTAERHAVPPSRPLPNGDGFVPIFNGKDLTGWNQPVGQGEWKVVGNVLTGVGAAGEYGGLLSIRSYANFHLRAEVRLTGPGNSGILFRSEVGYQLEIEKETTGSIARSKPFAWLDRKLHNLVEPGSWFTLDLIADGPQLTSKVNGQIVASVTDEGMRKGCLLLEVNGRDQGGMVIEFRKIEIKELPSSSPVSDKNQLQGAWVAESAESQGRPLPASRVKQIRLEFAGGNVRVTNPDRTTDGGIFKLDPTTDPKEIDVIRSGDEKGMRGIYRFDGDKLILCIGEPGPNRPREFRTGPNTGPLMLATLRRSTSAPPPAIAPFDAAKAKEHQDAWAKHLGVEVETTNSIGMKLRLVPPGEFTMGSPDSEPGRAAHEGPPHKVVLTQPFSIGVHPVTVAQFRAFVKAKGYLTDAENSTQGGLRFRAGKWAVDQRTNWQNPGFEQTDENPVTCVSWNDAQAFCEWLSALDGRRYTLPTEAQWEYACRSGSTAKYHFGDDDRLLSEFAWYGANSGGKSHRVGTKKPNAWGLYDMHGSLWQWTMDRYAVDSYRTSPKTDPRGPEAGELRVVRGGSWFDSESLCRSAHRGYLRQSWIQTHTGFRVAVVGDLKAKPPAEEVAPAPRAKP